MDRGSFMVYIKTDDRCKDVAEDVETSFGVSNYDLDRQNKKVIQSMKDDLTLTLYGPGEG